jgi:hypothetical protein
MTWKHVKRRPLSRRARGDDRDGGQITLAVVIFSVGALMIVSLVYFQGIKLRAGREAGNIAEETARAGAGQLDRSRAYTSGVKAVDPAAAVASARAYLASRGHQGDVTGSVVPVGGAQIRVTVTITRPAPLLSLIGVSTITVTRSATADLIVGVQGPGR